MVTRREAHLARAARLLVEAFARGEKNGGSVDWSDLEMACDQAAEALKMKVRPTRRRAVLVVRGGCVSLDWQDKGTRITVKNEDAGETRTYTTSLHKRAGAEQCGIRRL